MNAFLIAMMTRLPANFVLRRALAVVAVMVPGVTLYLLWPASEVPVPRHSPATQGAPANAAALPATASMAPVAPVAPVAKPVQEFADSLCQDMATSLGSVTDPAAFQPSLGAAQAQANHEVGTMLKQAMNSGDLLVRASALFLHAEFQAQSVAQELATKYPDCSKDRSCEVQMRAQVAAVRTKDLNEIARLAINSRDPLLYATAFYACSAWNKAADGSDVFCRQVSASQWALRDPDNGVPWLFAAQIASLENHSAELDGAMARLAQVKFFDERRVGLPQLRSTLGWQQKNAFTQLALANLNTAVYRQREGVQYRAMTDWCNGAANDNSRRAVCEGIASRMAADSDSMVRSGIGARLGEALGWPREKVAQLTLDQHAILGMELDGFAPRKIASVPPGPAGPMVKSCFDKLYEARHALNSMQFGDMAEARKQMANQSRTKAELAARFRATMAAEDAAASKPR